MLSMKYHIITFGCQMNKSDSERISAAFKRSGHEMASSIEGADLIIVNMCSVRQRAVDRVYGLAPKLKDKKTILTGCVLNRDRRKLAEIFDYILDIKELLHWPGLSIDNCCDSYLEIGPNYSNNFSALVPIMTGCNNFCSYCVVPYTRGRETSRPAEDIVKEVKSLVRKNYKEIWLLGQNVNAYKDEGKTFPDLLKMVNDIKGNFWIRFTSPHPKDFSKELIKIMANSEKVTEYLNLPVQSGDNNILKKMNRPYTREQYKNLVKEIRKQIPDIALSTDIIVGFPGETEEQFNNTAELFKKIEYDMAYIAKYSARSGTAASKLEDNVSPEEKDRREKILTEILKSCALKKNKKQIGQTENVLVSDCKQGFCIGKNRTHKTVKFLSEKNYTGQFVKVEITEGLPWGLTGKL